MKCFEYFLRLLSRREYSVGELLKKGKEKGFTQEEIAVTIDTLQSQDYQSDRRLVTMLIAASQGRYGKSMVKRKCLEKGVAIDLFEQIWMEQKQVHEEDAIDELSNLKAKVIRKYKIQDIHNIEPKTKSKLLNYLRYRGFSAFEVLRKWQEDE